MMKARYTLTLFLTLLFLTSFSFNVLAQDHSEEKHYITSDRNWSAELPFWIPSFRGQLAYGDLDLSGSGTGEEREFKRLHSKTGLEFYFVGRCSMQNNKLWVQLDGFSGKVSGVFSYKSLVGQQEKELLTIKIRGTFPRFVMGYAVWQKTTDKDLRIELIPYIGIRYVDFHLQSDVFDSAIVIDTHADWFEPVVGVYVPLSYKRFKMEFQADFGKVGLKNSWVFGNRLRYRISKLVDVQVGWNLIRLHHIETVNIVELESTITLFGPSAGIGFRF